MGTARLTLAVAAFCAVVACAAMPGVAKAGDAPATNSTNQEQRSTPQPPPSGCPFRNGKLELIA